MNFDLQVCSMEHFQVSDYFNLSHSQISVTSTMLIYLPDIWFFILSPQVPVSAQVISSLFVSIYRFVLSIYRSVLSIYRFVLSIYRFVLSIYRFVLSIYRSVLSIYRFVRLSHPPVSLIVQCIECVTCLAKQNPVKVSTNDFQVTLSLRCGLIDLWLMASVSCTGLAQHEADRLTALSHGEH